MNEFFKGIGNAINLFPESKDDLKRWLRKRREHLKRSDQEKLYGDWLNVGKDIAKGISLNQNHAPDVEFEDTFANHTNLSVYANGNLMPSSQCVGSLELMELCTDLAEKANHSPQTKTNHALRKRQLELLTRQLDWRKISELFLMMREKQTNKFHYDHFCDQRNSLQDMHRKILNKHQELVYGKGIRK